MGERHCNRSLFWAKGGRGRYLRQDAKTLRKAGGGVELDEFLVFVHFSIIQTPLLEEKIVRRRDHLADVTAKKTTKNASGFSGRNLFEGLKNTTVTHDDLLVGANRRLKEKCDERLPLIGRPSFKC